nr:DUF58 domain-containing protein [Paenibacillus turpanensis]
MYVTPQLERGYYTFGETICSTEDIFGFFEHRGTIRLPLSFSVLPKTVPIREWTQFRHLSKGNQNHSASTRHTSETTQINGVREYHYGDRLSRVHWNATARTGTWKSKEFEREALPRIVVILDREAASYESPEQFELAVSIAASLLQFAEQKQLAAGLLSTGRNSVFFEPGLGRAKLSEMMHHLIGVQADGAHDLIHVADNRSRQLSSGTVLAVVSPNTGASMLKVMGWMQTRQMTPCHFLVGGNGKGDWSTVLRSKGVPLYAVHELGGLSSVLGGMPR